MSNLCCSRACLPQSSAVFRALPRRNIFHSVFSVFAAALPLLALLGATAQAQKSAPPLSVKAPAVAPNAPTTMTPSSVLDGQAIRLGHLDPQLKLHVVLSIQPPHMAEEESFIQQLVTKGSPGFHKFLTPEQWNTRFAPSAEDEQKVVSWAESQGFTVTQRYPNRLLVEADGTVEAVEKAFGVTMNKYQVGNEVAFSNDRDPFIPSALTGILRNVLGLTSVERVHRTGVSKSRVRPALPAPGPLTGHIHGNGDPAKAPAARSAARQEGATASQPIPSDSFPLNGGVADPDSIQSSQGYDFNALQRLSHCCNEWGNASGSPPESSIALIGYGAFNVSDVTTFFGNYGMAYNIGWTCITGGGSGSTCPGVDGEAPLDVEYAGAMANSYGDWHATAGIHEYEMGDNLYSTYAAAFNRILSDNITRVVSTSYGWQENVGFSGSVATGTMHPIFNNMVGTGFTLIGSSGDSGASVGCGNSDSVDYPTSDPDFIAAGGTQLLLDANGIFQSEDAWEGEFWAGACASNHGGGTGGVSVLFVAPSWQSSQISPYYGWQGGTAYDGTEYVFTGGNGRMIPDISLTANPDVMGQWYYAGGAWQSQGGTSIVAPELAGFFAQENSYLDYVGNKCGGGSSPCSPVGNAAPFMYTAGNSGAPHKPFYDTTNGCDSNDITSAYSLVYWCAYAGWDPATGWGSANMLQLAWGINWWLIPAVGTPSLSFSGPATNTWYNSDQAVSWTLSDTGGSYPAPGVAGFTQGWDSIPADPSSEPHGGDGNSFYWGPQYAFASSGCLSFNGGFGCAGGSGQGCHTAQVEGWDNQGRTTTNSYGPLCFDNVAPIISDTTNPVTGYTTWVNQSVAVTLIPTDATSGVYRTYYSINTTACTSSNLGACTVYSGPVTFSTQGQSYIWFFTEDYAGNFSSTSYQWVSIDQTAPTTTPSLSGTIYSGSTYSTAVNVTLSGADSLSGVQHTYYQLDGGSTVTYGGSAFSVSTLGNHSVKYWSVDAAANIEAAKTISFSIHSPTTASLVATPNPSVLSHSVTMTTTVTATLSGTPTGVVTFWNGSASLGTATLSGGVASLSTTSLPAGSDTLHVSYAGAGNFLPGNSANISHTVESTAAMISPTPSTVLAGPKVTFTWSTRPAATQYALRLGTTVGGNNIYASGPIAATTTTVSTLPTNGQTIHARLTTFFGSSQIWTDYVYTAPTKAALTSPTPGLLNSPTITFNWSAGTGATSYALRLGAAVGGNSYYASGAITATSATVSGLPTNGSSIYARLTTFFGSTQVYTDYVYTAPTKAFLTSPTPGLLNSPNITFNWSAGTGATSYALRLGTAVGGNNLYASGATTATSATVSGLPTNGSSIYARLTTFFGSTQVYTDYVYTAPTKAALTSPTPGSVLTGATETFNWSAGVGATAYALRLGTTVGGNDIFASGAITTTSATRNNLPTNGSTIYARLTTFFGSTQVYTDYVYTAAP